MQKSKIFGIFLSAALLSTSLLMPAKADSWPGNYSDWSTCSEQAPFYCNLEFKTDTDGNSTDDWIDPPSNISLQSYFYNLNEAGSNIPSFSFRILREGQQELDPVLPAGSKVHLKFNLGPWNPRTDFSNATAKILNWDSELVDGNWIFSVDMQTVPYSFATECWPWSDPWVDNETGESGDYCTNPRHRLDYLSYAQAAVTTSAESLGSSNTSPNAGVWVSNNATGGTNPWLDPITKSFEMDYAGPPTKIDGTPNYISAQAYIPDNTLLSLYGVDPKSVTAGDSFSVTRRDGSSTTTVTANVTHKNWNVPGILINIPEIVTYVSAPANFKGRTGRRNLNADPTNNLKTVPKIVIKIKKFKASKPGKSSIKKIRVNGKFAILNVTIGAFASGIQPVCTKGRKQVTGTGMLAMAVASVKLTKGTWLCKVRSVRTSGKLKLYSAWSSTKSVKIK